MNNDELKKFGRKRLWVNQGTIQVFSRKWLKKFTNDFSQGVDVSVYIPTKYNPNTNLITYLCTTILGISIERSVKMWAFKGRSNLSSKILSYDLQHNLQLWKYESSNPLMHGIFVLLITWTSSCFALGHPTFKNPACTFFSWNWIYYSVKNIYKCDNYVEKTCHVRRKFPSPQNHPKEICTSRDLALKNITANLILDQVNQSPI
jgi:hypothetical protein